MFIKPIPYIFNFHLNENKAEVSENGHISLSS